MCMCENKYIVGIYLYTYSAQVYVGRTLPVSGMAHEEDDIFIEK